MNKFVYDRITPTLKVVGSNPVGRTKMNDPTQFEQVDETCEFGGGVLYSEGLDMTAFFEYGIIST